MRRKQKVAPPPPSQGSTASSADQAAAKYVAARQEAQRRQAAKLLSSHEGEDAIFQSFRKAVTRIQPPPGPATKPMGIEDIREMARAMGMSPDAFGKGPMAKPVNADRDWAMLFRNVTDGVYRAAQRVNDGLTEAETHKDLYPNVSAPLRYVDATGEHEAPVHRLSLPEDTLRRSDDAVGRRIDAAVAKVILRQANTLLGEGYMDAEEAVAAAALEHALYPVIYFAPKLREISDKAGRIAYVLVYAIAWMYEPGLDDEDDDD